jgi:hypothetical protein
MGLLQAPTAVTNDLMNIAQFLQLAGASQGRIANFLVGLVAVLLGAKTLYDAYKGVWFPGHRGSDRPPIKAEWYHRAFLLILGFAAICLGCVLISRGLSR